MKQTNITLSNAAISSLGCSTRLTCISISHSFYCINHNYIAPILLNITTLNLHQSYFGGLLDGGAVDYQMIGRGGGGFAANASDPTPCFSLEFDY